MTASPPTKSNLAAHYSAMIGDHGPTRMQKATDEIMAILNRFPPHERRAILAEIAKEVMKGA